MSVNVNTTNAPNPTDPEVGCIQSIPFSINTVAVSLQAGTVRARAILDSGASASLMTESLATTLKLKRHPQRITLDGYCGSNFSKFCVVATLVSLHNPEKSVTLTFNVVPKLKPVAKPHDAKKLLLHPSLKDLPVADPELGGPVDIYIGNAAIDKCLDNGRIVYDNLKAVNTIFGWSIAGPLTSTSSAASLSVQAHPDNLEEELQ